MRSAVVAFVVGALAAAGAPTLAHADAAADQAAALAALDRGVALFRTADYPEALAAFTEAQRAAPDKPNPYRWLALTQVQLRDCPAALGNIESFLARVPPADARRPEMLRLRELCRHTGSLAITSSPPAATLGLDGKVLGTAPYRVPSLVPGTYEITAELPDYRIARRSVLITAGAETTLAIALESASPRLTERAWFWPVVGGVVLAAVAVGVYALVSSDDPAGTVLPPIQCTPTGCSP